jgi:hypothetical protein
MIDREIEAHEEIAAETSATLGLTPVEPESSGPVLVDVESGELLPATVPNAARILLSARTMKAKLNAVVAETTDWLVEESRRLGSKTLRDGGAEITLSGGDTIDYDPERLARNLRAVGCPEDRIDEAIVATVSYKINRSVLRSIASANPDYREAIRVSEIPAAKPYRASVKG